MLKNDPTELILDALAVSEDALTLTALARILASAGVRISGRKPSTALIQPWITDLARRGLVNQSGRVEPVKPASELRARSLLRSGRYAEVAQWVASAEPLQPPSWSSEVSRRGTIAREYRRAIHSGNISTVTALQKRARASVWLWFCDPVDPDLLRMLSPSVSTHIFRQLARASFHHALPAPGLRDLIYETVLKQPELLETAACEAILYGEQDRADAFLRQLDRGAGLHTRALRALIEGDIKTAVSLYAKGLTADRKQQGSPKVLPAASSSLFLPLAYLLSSSKSRGSQALRLIEMASSTDLITAKLPWGGWDHLRTLNEPSTDDGLACTHPVAVLLEGLCTWWRGEKLSTARREAAIETAQACGWGWIADELVCSEEGEGLGSLREVRAEWAHRLELLAELLGEKPAKARPLADKRLAWTLEEGAGWLNLEAREQLRRAGGKWSVGRKVSCARLLGSGSPPTTTATDRALISALRSETHRSYRGYPETEYLWEPTIAWPALVGHPAVFDPKGRALTIVGIKPRIVVKRTRGKSTVRIEPPATDKRVKVVKVGNGYEVTVFTAEQLRIAEVIGGGMTVPARGSAALEGVLSATEGIFAPIREESVAKI
ncbi:MAG: hypothetical protein ACI8S6_004455, partial [Myxococcota bacterium]